MSSFPALQTQMASVMETLVHAAVAELGKLVEDSTVFVFHLHLSREGGAEDREGGAEDREGGAEAREGGAEDREGGAEAKEDGANHREGGANHREGGANTREGGANAREGGANHREGGANTREGGANAREERANMKKALVNFQRLFASSMETLGNEALGKLVNMLEDVKVLMDFEERLFRDARGKRKRPQTSMLTILSGASVEDEHCYSKSPTQEVIDEQGVPEEVDPGFVLAVSLKDQHGDIDLEAITSRAAAEAESSLNSAPTGDSAPMDLSSRQRPHNKTSGPPRAVQVLASGRKKHFLCPHCGKSLSKMESLRAHLRVHTGERPFVCDVCDRGFAQSSGLRRHARTHTGERPHACEHCDARFASAEGLRAHGSVHTRMKPYPCTVCRKSFSRKKNLARHVLTHSEEKATRFSCDQCGKGFTNKYNLKHHKMKHMGDTPFKCPLCPKSFTSHLQMRGHKNKVHKPFALLPCDVCGKKVRDSHMKNHMFIHTKPFKCKKCDQSFSNQPALKAHSFSHSGKTLRCDFCDKTFDNPVKHRTHLRSHLPEKPYSCNYCKQRFPTAKRLVKHVEVHHTRGKREVECKLCGESFAAASLYKHKKQMHPELTRHYDCYRCGRRYPNQRSLKTHQCEETSE